MSAAKVINKKKSFGGYVLTLQHDSTSLGCEMKFTMYYPPKSKDTPVLVYLSGLTCNHENFITKGCAIEYAAKHNVCLVCPDTSPRGDGVPVRDILTSNASHTHTHTFLTNTGRSGYGRLQVGFRIRSWILCRCDSGSLQ